MDYVFIRFLSFFLFFFGNEFVCIYKGDLTLDDSFKPDIVIVKVVPLSTLCVRVLPLINHLKQHALATHISGGG